MVDTSGHFSEPMGQALQLPLAHYPLLPLLPMVGQRVRPTVLATRVCVKWKALEADCSWMMMRRDWKGGIAGRFLELDDEGTCTTGGGGGNGSFPQLGGESCVGGHGSGSWAGRFLQAAGEICGG